MKSKKNKILFACIMTAILTNCGGGGGGSSAVSVQPSTPGISKNHKKDIHDNSGSNTVVVENNKNVTDNPVYIPSDNNLENNNSNHTEPLKKMPVEEIIIPQYRKPLQATNNYIVAIMDSDFLTHKEKLKNRYKGIEILEKFSSNPQSNGSPHGERVLDIMTENANFKIVAATIGEHFGGNSFVHPSLELYKEIFKRFGNQKVKIINQSWGMDLNEDIKTINNYEKLLLPTQLVGGDVKEIVESIDAPVQRGKELLKFYRNSVNDGGLFVWANGNHSSNGHNAYNPSVQAQLPVRNPSLEKGWISVIGVQEKYLIELANKNSDYYAYKHYDDRLAYPGYAANWSISASGDGLASAKGTIGSSYAAPRVARAAALVANQFPWMSNSQIRETLFTTTNKPELRYDSNGNLLNYFGAVDNSQETRYINYEPDPRYGWGILNTERALKGPGAFLTRLLEKDRTLNSYGISLYFQANIPEGEETYFDNDIHGDAGIRKLGKGRLYLTGNNSFTGTSKISEGTMDIYKSNEGNIDIEENGTLILHNGVVIGNQSYRIHEYDGNVQNDGKLILDGKKATILGSYIASNRAITEIDFSSTLEVKGKTVLNSSTLKINSDEYPAQVQQKEIIKGDIKDVNVETIQVNGMRKATAHKTDNSLIVEMSREHTANYLGEMSTSQENVANNIEKVLQDIDNKAKNNQLSDEYLQRAKTIVEMSSSSLKESTYKMSGEIYASAQALSFAQSLNINRNISNHLSSLNNFRKSDYEWQGWMSGIHSEGNLKDEGYATGKTKMNGTQFGIDKKISHSVQAGVSLSYSDAEAKFNKYAGVSKSSSLGASIYSKKYFKNDIYILGRAGISKFTSKVQRELIDIDGDTVVGNIKHKDYMFSGYLETGKHFANFTPYIGISQDYLKRGSFQENNAAWGINALEKNYLSTNILLGLRSEYKMNSYTFTGYITHSINVGNRSLNFDGKFTGTDTPQTFKGIDLNKNITWTGIGISKEITPQFNINANLDVRFEGKHRADSVISAGLEYRF